MSFKRLNSQPGSQSDSESSDFERMLAESFDKSDRRVSVGDKLKCEVVSVGKEHVIVSTGTRFDGFVAASELSGEDAVAPGALVDLYVTQVKGSTLTLSKYPGGRIQVPSRAEAARATVASLQLKEGDAVKGTVTRVTDFGAFIEIAPGVEGLAHVSQLSWKRVNKPEEVVKVGDKVNATILRIEEGERRQKISLTLKSASSDPWNNVSAEVAAGRVIKVKVTRLAPFGAFAEIQPGVEGLIPLSEMARGKRINSADEVVKVGDELSVLVKDFNKETRRASLSIKDAQSAAESLDESENLREYAARQKSQSADSSMGDLGSKLQAALAKAKK